MQHYLYPAPLPPPLPPPQATGGRGTILSQEARLHALQIAEEIQAERGSYRKWNEVAKAVNRQYGSNVDGDLVKRQVTSMLRSVQRSGINSVKRPRKHAEVIQQLLDPTAKRQCIDGQPLRIENGEGGEDDEDGIGERIGVDVEDGDKTSNTGSESSPPHSPRNSQSHGDSSGPTISSVSDSSSSSTSKAITTISSTGDESKPESTRPPAESHSIERVHKPKRNTEPKTHTSHSFSQILSLQTPMPQQPLYSAPPRIMPNMSVDEVYNLVVRLLPDVDAEFIRVQEIDGGAFQTLTHKELTDFGVPTFGKRNKLLQLCISFDAQAPPPPPPPQDFYFGRIPTSFPAPSPFLEAKAEQIGEKSDSTKEGGEKKPPVTKILGLEVVGVRKRYLVERENGAVEVLTPCKLRKYKTLTVAFEHIHPDKLVPLPSFSTTFSHVPSAPTTTTTSSSDDPSKTPSDSNASPSTPSSPHSKPSKSSKTKSSPSSSSPSSQAGGFVASGYYPVFYSSSTFPVMGPPSSSAIPSSNLQWIHSAYPGITSQRTPEKYHSFHPYHGPPK